MPYQNMEKLSITIPCLVCLLEMRTRWPSLRSRALDIGIGGIIQRGVRVRGIGVGVREIGVGVCRIIRKTRVVEGRVVEARVVEGIVRG